LNENFLERNMQAMLSNEERLAKYYDSWAFVRDAELGSMLPTTAAGE
jgi:hypothetical protein